jgi:hypothetical protein
MLNRLLGLRLNTYNLRSKLRGFLAQIILHEGEGNDFLDAVMVSQEHDQAINSKTPSATIEFV